MTKSTMANGTQSVSYKYDQLNRPISYTDALGKTETYTYNNYGDMTSKNSELLLHKSEAVPHRIFLPTQG